MLNTSLDKVEQTIKTQQNFHDFIKDISSLVFSHHIRSKKYGIMLDRLHDVAIFILLLIVCLYMFFIGIVGLFASPSGYKYTYPKYWDSSFQRFAGLTKITDQYELFSPHNGRFSFKMGFSYNRKDLNFLKDDFKFKVHVEAKMKDDDSWYVIEEERDNKRGLWCFSKGIHAEVMDYDNNGELVYKFKRLETPACHEILILHSISTYKIYRISITFDPENEELYEKGFFNNGNITTRFEMNSEKYTTFEWVLRLVFSLGSLIVFLAYFITMFRTQKIKNWNTQQKWLAVLLAEMIFYHDPLYVLDVYIGFWIFPIIGTLLQMTFVFTFLCYLLIFFHSLFKLPQDRNFFNFWFTKLLIVCPTYFITVILFVTSRLYYQWYPAHDSLLEVPIVYYSNIALSMMIVVYIFYLIYYVSKAIGNIKRMRKEFSSRFKVVGGLSFLCLFAFLGSGISVEVFRFGSPGFEFLISNAMIQTYFGCVAFLFLPSTYVIRKKKNRKGENSVKSHDRSFEVKARFVKHKYKAETEKIIEHKENKTIVENNKKEEKKEKKEKKKEEVEEIFKNVEVNDNAF